MSNRFTIDMPALHDFYVRQLDEQLYSFDDNEEHAGMHLAEMFIELWDCGAIYGPGGLTPRPMGFDEFEDPACIVVFLQDSTIDGTPGWGFPMIHELDEYLDEPERKGEILTLAGMEAAARNYVHQLNELDRWRLIKR